MAMSFDKWTKVSESQYPWEREALEYVRTNLSDHEPYRAWSNFEFIADDGTINEVDLLVVTPMGFFMVEIKGKPGRLYGDAMTWHWHPPRGKKGNRSATDNPLILCNRKVKKLASMLQRQSAFSKYRCPFLDAVVFCSAEDLVATLQGNAALRIAFRESEAASRPGIIGALKRRDLPGLKQDVPKVSKPQAKSIARALEQLGIRASQGARRIGDYVLDELLYENARDNYQDFLAEHSSATVKGLFRVRIYNEAQDSDQEDRQFLRKAAEREYELCRELRHDAILPVTAFTENELGPALIFEHYEGAERLDHYISSRASTLTIDTKLAMIRKLAEALHYAHGKHIVHRLLSPQSILVLDDGKTIELKIFNWMAGRHDSTTDGATRTGTVAPDQLVDDDSMVYISPEAVYEPSHRGRHLDVFSLGAITYHIISGQPPAVNFHELTQILEKSDGLDICKVSDSAPPELSELIHFCTARNYENRYDSIDEFLHQLEQYEDKLTEPDNEFKGNPLDAKVNDRLKGGYVVKSRLGKGSTAVAFLVEKDNKELVLKLANKKANNKRIKAEYECLKKLDYELIVEAFELIDIDGFKGFTMRQAGKNTLAEELRQIGRLQLELLGRYGEDLLQIVNELERAGINHRDIKPDNIGIGSVTAKSKYRLQLFDFSLAGVSVDNIMAGTPPYRDRFLSDVDRHRWDSAAERFSASMTLYEMATATNAQWSNGYSEPVTIDAEAFESAIREPLTAFFTKALQNRAKDRFDNAEIMLREWRTIFKGAGEAVVPTTITNDGSAEDMSTPLVTLGISALAASAFEKLNLVTVGELLKTSVYKIKHIRGTGLRTQKEIMALYDRLKENIPDVEADQSDSADGSLPGAESIDVLVSDLDRIGASKKEKLKVLHAFFGLTPADTLGFWPSIHDVGAALKCEPTTVSSYLQSARASLRKISAFAAVRCVLSEILEHACVMPVTELARALLTARGSVAAEKDRLVHSLAVLRAALEAERTLDKPEFVDFRLGDRVYISLVGDLAPYVAQLGAVADGLAALDPLASSEHALRELRAVPLPDGISPVRRDRDLLMLASHASDAAAMSSRLEVYPRGMEAKRALTLAQGTISGVPQLGEDEITSRVLGRYPTAQALPGRPTLDQWLQDIGLDLVWDSNTEAFVYPRSDSLTLTSTGSFVVPPESPDHLDARRFQQLLNTEFEAGGYLVLMCPAKYLPAAETQLSQAFGLRIFDMDRIVIAAMKQAAAEFEVDWDVVLEADGAAADSEDWENLSSLVQSCCERIEAAFRNVEEPILMTNAGLLTRYNQLGLISKLRERALANDGIRTLWLLVPAHGHTPYPMLNNQSIPVLGRSQYAEVPIAWLSANVTGKEGAE